MFCLPLCCAGQAYREVAERAFAALRAQNYTLAIATYDSAFAIDSPEPIDVYNVACSYARLKQNDKAISFLNRAFELGYEDFDWTYYDKDLDNIRDHPGYKQITKKYGSDSTVYFFEILRALATQERPSFVRKHISVNEDAIAAYSLQEIQARVGLDVVLPILGDSLFDFSTKTLEFTKCRFEAGDAFNSIRNLKLRSLVVVDCSGTFALSNVDVEDVEFHETAIGGGSNNLIQLKLENVNQHGQLYMQANGLTFQVENSSFTSVADQYETPASLFMYMTYTRVDILNSTFKAVTEHKSLVPHLLFAEGDFLFINKSRFLHPIKIYGTIEKNLGVQGNEFATQLDLLSLRFPDFDSYFPYDQIRNTAMVKATFENFNTVTIKGDSIEDYSDRAIFDEFTGLYKRLYDDYRDRADIASANAVYVRMKELEIMHLSKMNDRTSEETMRLRLNQIMGMYTDHATSPGKALIGSFYIILLFGIFYCFFPSDWDKTSKQRVIADFKLFVEKNEHGYVKPFLKMLKGILLSLLNAAALSLNAFITLGFGNIPTSGVARYVCILEGALGWFLLSLFTVALLNQVLL